MRALLHRIGQIGVDSTLSTSDAKHVALTNQTAFGMSLVALAGLGNPFYWAVPPVLACALVQAVGFPLVLALNHVGQRLLARLYFAGLSIAALTFMTVMLGDRSECGYFLPIVGLVAWLIYGREEWRWPALVTAASLTAFLAVPWLADRVAAPGVPEPLLRAIVLSNRVLFFVVLMVFGVVAFLQTNGAEERLEAERRKSEKLLRNILPARIAERLKHSEESIAERFDEATVLFADLVNFTVLAERVPAPELVRLLDEVFTSFDRLADAHGLEKIKTIGDAYMVAAGIPEPRADHVEAVARMALEMPRALAAIPAAHGLHVRIGVHTGPVVAGVIGKRKFAYDLWGDTVNTASRMESHGAPGRVHVTEAVFRSLRDRYAFDPRGVVAIKGKGELTTYFLVGAIPAPEREPASPDRPPVAA